MADHRTLSRREFLVASGAAAAALHAGIAAPATSASYAYLRHLRAE
ncbi:MAG TPA: twin-arginine translocation signal domain-containing protein [Jiangellaceae bacterium]